MIKKALRKVSDTFVSFVFGIGAILVLMLGFAALMYVVVWFTEKTDLQNLLMANIGNPTFIIFEVIIVFIGLIWVLVTVGNNLRERHSARLPKWLKKEKDSQRSITSKTDNSDEIKRS